MTNSTLDMAMSNAFNPATGTVGLPQRTQDLIARRAEALGPAYRLFYEAPLEVVRGESVWLYDADGERYLDVYNNVASMGHCHPHVVQAVARQLGALNTHTRYLNETVIAYAERLLGTFGDVPRHLMMTCTGSEANDLALRIAQTHTGATGIVVTRLAYHGLTNAIAAVSPSLGPSGPQGAHVRLVDAPTADAGAETGVRFAAGVAAAIADLQRSGYGVAAMFCDTIFSSDGVFADPPGFLSEAVRKVQAAGGLFVADEVQPGFGRTGTHMWGYQRHGITPDIVSMGKPMGNGYPVAGIAVRQDMVRKFGQRARYFNTFGGSQAACAAGSAVLDVIAREGLLENANTTGAYLQAGIAKLASEFSVLRQIRGAGLFIGVDVDAGMQSLEADGALAAHIVNSLRQRKVLISASGPAGRVLKIRPPMVFRQEHADIFLDALHDAMTSLRLARDPWSP
ncbi:MAG TPA: aspartate aminotransferase family protein [Burkholderiaceae bacterium]